MLQSSSEYKRLLHEHVNSDNVETALGFDYSAYGYDSVWTAALALHDADLFLRSQGKPVLKCGMSLWHTILLLSLFP